MPKEGRGDDQVDPSWEGQNNSKLEEKKVQTPISWGPTSLLTYFAVSMTPKGSNAPHKDTARTSSCRI